MNPYEQHLVERRERFLRRAERLEAAAAAAQRQSSQLVDGIPLGQPILVGHHSERRHRRTLERSHAAMDRCVRLQQLARKARDMADGVGRAGISSDDPEATTKLEAKAQTLEERRAHMVSVNKAWRQEKKPAPDNKEGWSRIAARLGLPLDQLGPTRIDMAKRHGWYHGAEQAPFPAYALQNLGGRIRQAKQRRETLEAAPTEDREYQHGAVTVIENVEEHRLQLRFPGKPDGAVRQRLKQAGFRWSPTQGVWQRHLNAAARCAVTAALGPVPGD